MFPTPAGEAGTGVKAVADSKTDALMASTSVANITFDKAAITAISKEASGDVKVITSKVDTASLSEAAKAYIDVVTRDHPSQMQMK